MARRLLDNPPLPTLTPRRAYLSGRLEGLDMVSEMLEQKSAAEIGEYGYSHWTGKQVTPGVHGLACVPQSIADGWDAYCSCGEWRAFESMWDCPTTGILLDKLRVAHEKHCASLGAEVSYPNTPSKDPTDAE